MKKEKRKNLFYKIFFSKRNISKKVKIFQIFTRRNTSEKRIKNIIKDEFNSNTGNIEYQRICLSFLNRYERGDKKARDIIIFSVKKYLSDVNSISSETRDKLLALQIKIQKGKH